MPQLPLRVPIPVLEAPTQATGYSPGDRRALRTWGLSCPSDTGTHTSGAAAEGQQDGTRLSCMAVLWAPAWVCSPARKQR